MNARIRELKEQAFNFVAKQNMCKKEYFWENIRHNPELQDSVDAKFAELIVRECCEVAIQDWYTPDGWGFTSGQQKAASFIKEHFGVE